MAAGEHHKTVGVAALSLIPVVLCSAAVIAAILYLCRRRTGEAPEAVVFRRHYDTLKIAIQSPESVADKLFAKQMIDVNVKEKLYLLVFTTSEKCSILLSGIERKIKADSSGFYVFVDALQEEPATQKVADWLLRDVKLFEGESSTMSARGNVTGLALCVATLLLLSVLDIWKLELGIAPYTCGVTAGVGIFTLAVIWERRKPTDIDAVKLREDVAQSKTSESKYIHSFEDRQRSVEVDDEKQYQSYSTGQHGAVRLKDLAMLRYTGPLATRRYHRAQRVLMNLYLSDKAEDVAALTKRIVESNCSDDIKVIVLCHEAAIKIALQGEYSYAEGLLRNALEKATQQGCRNSTLLQGKVFWHYALLLYNQGKRDKALEYISKAKDRLFYAAPEIDTASVIYWEIGLKELMLGSEFQSTKLSRQSFEEDYDRLIGHASCFQHEYQKTALCLYLTDKAMFHLRTYQITDELPPVECWPTSGDIQKAESCLKGVPLKVLPNEVNYYTAGYYLALCDLHLWKLKYPEARKYARQAKQQCIQLGITHKDAQRPDMRLKLLEKRESPKIVELTGDEELEGDEELDEILPEINWPTNESQTQYSNIH